MEQLLYAEALNTEIVLRQLFVWDNISRASFMFFVLWHTLFSHRSERYKIKIYSTKYFKCLVDKDIYYNIYIFFMEMWQKKTTFIVFMTTNKVITIFIYLDYKFDTFWYFFHKHWNIEMKPLYKYLFNI